MTKEEALKMDVRIARADALDRFACAAMQTILRLGGAPVPAIRDREVFAKSAYDIAEAMLAEREKRWAAKP